MVHCEDTNHDILLKWLWSNWNAMRDSPEFPTRAMIYIVMTLFLMLPLQLTWTALIIRKILQKISGKQSRDIASNLLDKSIGKIKES